MAGRNSARFGGAYLTNTRHGCLSWFALSGTHDSDFYSFCNGKVEPFYLHKYLGKTPNVGHVFAEIKIICTMVTLDLSLPEKGVRKFSLLTKALSPIMYFPMGKEDTHFSSSVFLNAATSFVPPGAATHTETNRQRSSQAA